MYVTIIIKENMLKKLYMVMDTGGVGEMLPWKGWVEGMEEGKLYYSTLSIK